MARKTKSGLVGMASVRKFVEAARANDDRRPVLQCICIEDDTAVTADGFALHVARFASSAARAQVFENVGVFAPDGSLSNGAFPDWRSIAVHSSVSHFSFRVHRAELLRLVKLAAVFTRKDAPGVGLVWDAESYLLTVVGVDSAVGDTAGVLPALPLADASARAVVGASASIIMPINHSLVLRALRGMSSEFIAVYLQAQGDNVWFSEVVQTEAGAVTLEAFITGMSRVERSIAAYTSLAAEARGSFDGLDDRWRYGADMPKSRAVKVVKAFPHQLTPGPAIVHSRASWDTSPAPAVDYVNRVRLAGMLAGRADAACDKRARARAESFALRYMRSGGMIARLESMAFIDGVKEGKLWYAENDNAEHSAFIIERLRLASLIYARLDKRHAEASALNLQDVTGALYEEVKIGARMDRLHRLQIRLRNSLHYVFHGRAVDAENEGKARGRNWESADDARAWVVGMIARRDQRDNAPAAPAVVVADTPDTASADDIPFTEWISTPKSAVSVIIRHETDPFGNPAWYAYQAECGTPLYIAGRSIEDVSARLTDYGEIIVDTAPAPEPIIIAPGDNAPGAEVVVETASPGVHPRAGRSVRKHSIRSINHRSGRRARVTPVVPSAPVPLPSLGDQAPNVQPINALTFDELGDLMARKLADAARAQVDSYMLQVGRELQTARAWCIASIEAAHNAPAQVVQGPVAAIEDMPLACDWDKAPDVCQTDSAINADTFGPDWSVWGEFWEAPPSPSLEDTQPMPAVDDGPEDDPETDPPAPGGGADHEGRRYLAGMLYQRADHSDRTTRWHRTFQKRRHNAALAFYRYGGHSMLHDAAFNAGVTDMRRRLGLEVQTEIAAQNAISPDGVGGSEDEQYAQWCARYIELHGPIVRIRRLRGKDSWGDGTFEVAHADGHEDRIGTGGANHARNLQMVGLEASLIASIADDDREWHPIEHPHGDKSTDVSPINAPTLARIRLLSAASSRLDRRYSAASKMAGARVAGAAQERDRLQARSNHLGRGLRKAMAAYPVASERRAAQDEGDTLGYHMETADEARVWVERMIARRAGDKPAESAPIMHDARAFEFRAGDVLVMTLHHGRGHTSVHRERVVKVNRVTIKLINSFAQNCTRQRESLNGGSGATFEVWRGAEVFTLGKPAPAPGPARVVAVAINAGTFDAESAGVGGSEVDKPADVRQPADLVNTHTFACAFLEAFHEWRIRKQDLERVSRQIHSPGVVAEMERLSALIDAADKRMLEAKHALEDADPDLARVVVDYAFAYAEMGNRLLDVQAWIAHLDTQPRADDAKHAYSELAKTLRALESSYQHARAPYDAAAIRSLKAPAGASWGRLIGHPQGTMSAALEMGIQARKDAQKRLGIRIKPDGIEKWV